MNDAPASVNIRPAPRHHKNERRDYERVPNAEEDAFEPVQVSPLFSPLQTPQHMKTSDSQNEDAEAGKNNEKQWFDRGDALSQSKEAVSHELDVGPEPRLLVNVGYHKWRSFTLDVGLCLLPLAFVVIATVALSLNNAPRSSSGDRVKAYTFLAPTIFPIVYAAILGRTLRRVGLYMAEKGSTIGTLERIVGCQSLFSAIERQYTLRHFDMFGFLILLVWLLSPVGGQSSLRLLAYQPQTEFSVTPAYYYPMQGYIWASLLEFHDAMRFHHVSVPYMAALQSSGQTMNSSRDMWGNLKIPDIRQFDDYRPSENESTWYQINNDTDLSYISLLGVPVFGMSKPGNSTFNLTSHYWSIDCDKGLTNTSKEYSLPSQSDTGTYALFTENITSTAGTMTVYASRKPLVGAGLTSNFTYGSIVSVTCYAQPLLVETHIACWRTTCRAQAIRELDWRPFADHRQSMYSQYPEFLDKMTSADRINTDSAATQSQMTETFITDQIRLAGYGPGTGGSWVDITSLPSRALSTRLQQAINTYWDASVGNLLRSWDHHADEKPPPVCTVQRWKCDARNLNWNVTAFHLTRDNGVKYVCNSSYAVVTIAISCFLFLAAVASLVLGVVITAPDILGFVSTAARNSVFFREKVPSYLDGLEAARELRDTPVIIGDVAGEDDEVGRVAFTSLDKKARRLRRDRLYD